MAVLMKRSFAFLLVARSAAHQEILEAADLAKQALDAGIGQVVRFDTTGQVAETADETGTPVVMMHGMGDFAKNPMGMIPLSKLIGQTANAYVHNVEICNSPDKLQDCVAQDQQNGFLMTMDDSVDQFARVVQGDPKLAGGFNAVGFSQGNLIIRGYIHRFNNPPVKNFLSFHGPLMGVANVPHCPLHVPVLAALCRAVPKILDLGLYTQYVQGHLAQANYFRDPMTLESYRKYLHFLPFINNEAQGKKNSTYADNFKSLEKLVLVMAGDDTMVQPKESEHFGYFKDGSNTELVAMKDAPWYTEDWFGLKSLDEANKVDNYTTPGDHLRFTKDFLVQMVQKYFKASAEIIV